MATASTPLMAMSAKLGPLARCTSLRRVSVAAVPRIFTSRRGLHSGQRAGARPVAAAAPQDQPEPQNQAQSIDSPEAELQQQQQQQHQLAAGGLTTQQQASGGTPISRRGGGAGALAPTFSDLLNPWFPGDRSLHQMLNAVDRLFDDAWAPAAPWGRHRRGARAPGGLGMGFPRRVMEELMEPVRQPWDVTEDDAAYHLRFDLPGLDKGDVSVRLDDDNTLHIRGQHNKEEKEGDVWVSRVAKKYQTSFTLPDNIKRDAIDAEMKHGVLTVRVPKVPPEEVKEGSITIPVA